MPTYYAETNRGCTLRWDTSLESARRKLISEAGTSINIKLMRKATARDIAWVRRMGGYAPQPPLSKRQKDASGD